MTNKELRSINDCEVHDKVKRDWRLMLRYYEMPTKAVSCQNYILLLSVFAIVFITRDYQIDLVYYR